MLLDYQRGIYQESGKNTNTSKETHPRSRSSGTHLGLLSDLNLISLISSNWMALISIWIL